MKLVFVHDHIFYKNNNQFYSTGGLSGDALKRYVDVAENVTVIARCVEVNNTVDQLTLASVKGTNFVIVPNHKSISKFYKIKEVKRIIKNEILSADYVIARSSSLGDIAAQYAEHYKKPYLIEVVGCTWDSLWNYNWKGKILAPFKFYTLKRLVKKAPFVLYVTKEFLQKRYPTYGKSVNCSNVSLKNFEETVLNNRIKKIKSLSSNQKRIIGTIGAVDVKYKGQESIIKSLSELKKLGLTNFEYQLVGSGNISFLKSVAEKYEVADKVKFLGTLPHEEVFKWLDSIDIYIQPSKTEGLPRGLVEAMSRGLFALGTNVGGIPELLDEKYLFSRSKRNYKEIGKLLSEINETEMILQAKRNINISKEYEKQKIESRRQLFLKNFISQS